MSGNFSVMNKTTKKVYKVYDVVVTKQILGVLVEFLIYKDGSWCYEDADAFTPNFQDDGCGNLEEYDPNW